MMRTSTWWTSVWVGFAACLLAGCAYGGGGQNQQNTGSWGQSIARYALDKQCHTELQKRSEWQAAGLVLGSAQKTALENKICACAADETSRQLGTLDVVKLVSESQRQKVIADLSVRTVSECSKRLILGQ